MGEKLLFDKLCNSSGATNCRCIKSVAQYDATTLEKQSFSLLAVMGSGSVCTMYHYHYVLNFSVAIWMRNTFAVMVRIFGLD